MPGCGAAGAHRLQRPHNRLAWPRSFVYPLFARQALRGNRCFPRPTDFPQARFWTVIRDLSVSQLSMSNAVLGLAQNQGPLRAPIHLQMLDIKKSGLQRMIGQANCFASCSDFESAFQVREFEDPLHAPRDVDQR